MKVFLLVCVIATLVCVHAEKEVNAKLPLNMRHLARPLRESLLARRSVCGGFGDHCSEMLFCCDDYDCDFPPGSSTGKCIGDWKK